MMPVSALSLDAKWTAPDADKIFLVFPDGQFDLQSVAGSEAALGGAMDSASDHAYAGWRHRRGCRRCPAWQH